MLLVVERGTCCATASRLNDADEVGPTAFQALLSQVGTACVGAAGDARNEFLSQKTGGPSRTAASLKKAVREGSETTIVEGLAYG